MGEGIWFPQRPHLSGACNEPTGGMKRGGCVNLAVVPNESRSYFEEFLCLSGAVSMFATWNFFFFSVRFERLCLFQPAPAVQWNVFKMSLALCGLAGSRVGWSWLRTFWSPFAKVLQQEVEADGFTGVVSVFIVRDIWGEKAFSFSPEEAQVLTRYSDQLVCE